MNLDELRLMLFYDPESGSFSWIKSPNRRIKVGSFAGSYDRDKYVRICIDGTTYFAHRLAWAFMFDEFPTQFIDHINGVHDDNRIANLRDVSPRENAQNRRKAPSHSRTGLLGACLISSTGKFMARINISGAEKFLGNFDTAEDAHRAYLQAKRKEHTTCTL